MNTKLGLTRVSGHCCNMPDAWHSSKEGASHVKQDGLNGLQLSRLYSKESNKNDVWVSGRVSGRLMPCQELKIFS